MVSTSARATRRRTIREAALRRAQRPQPACVDYPPDLFDSDSYDVELAKAVCATCPLAVPCHQEALANQEWGIWGGTTEEERYGVKRDRLVRDAHASEVA